MNETDKNQLEHMSGLLWDIVNDFDNLLRYGYHRKDHPSILARVDAHSKNDSLEAIQDEIADCMLCNLYEKRNKTVPGTGDVKNVQVLIIGEAPGMEEDKQGLPFVGRAGRYLDKWLEAIGLSRNNGVYITNTVKCRPPDNRDPHDEESSACMPYFIRQVALLKPRVILCVGRISASILLKRSVRIGRERGQWLRFMNIPLIATYHPSAVLRNPDLRRPVWEDMQKLLHGLNTGEFD